MPGSLGLALAPGRYVVAGSYPHLCRPSAAYLVEAAGSAGVQVNVVYSAGGGRMVGRRFWWGRARLEAAWRFGDVRVVARWQAPTETLAESRDRRLDPRRAQATGQAAIAAGG